MKRDKNLQSLSRDHHHGLLLSWKIRQGLKYLASGDLIAEYIHYFAETALLPHFAEEEQYILPYLESEDPLKLRTLEEHRTILSLIEHLDSQIDQSAAFLKVAQLLEEHIRFEERELFPYLQEVLKPGELDQIGLAIDAQHSPFIESFHTEFWAPAD
jgi:hypothetical protein